jgi:hypothetical protein
MNFRVFLLGWAIVALVACDRGAGMYDKAVETEKTSPDQARFDYEQLLKSYPTSKKAPDAAKAYVRLSLEACDTALKADDAATCATRLGEAQPYLADDAEKARFQELMKAERGVRLLQKQSGEIREFLGRLAELAGAEAKAQLNIERQAEFKWDPFVLPTLGAKQRALLHLGVADGVQRTAFEFGRIRRAGDGQYVVETQIVLPGGKDPTELYVQATTNGWRIVCAQRSGGNLCQDPWAYKRIE